MALVLGDLYAALVAAGSDKDKAMKAAAEVLQAVNHGPFAAPGRREGFGNGVLAIVFMSGPVAGLMIALLLQPIAGR